MEIRTQLPRRSRLVDVGNRTLPALWKAGLLANPCLDADQLIDDACSETGLSDFGDDWFRQPLEVLVRALRDEAGLNPVGRLGAHGQFRKTLRDRLWTQAWFARHPGIANRSLARPVIVVGPMRSGTTRLHRLLASDARFAHMRFFETICPTPRPDFERGGRDRRIGYAARLLAAVHRLNPNTANIHPTGATEPEEELGLLVASRWGMKHEAQWHVPAYGAWATQQDATPAYRHMARLLRLIGWARGDDDSRPWVLKTPQHMLDLPALLRVFPDARLIFTHRAPTAVVGSSCSLVYNQMIIHSDHVDPHRIGKEWLAKTQLQVARMRRARLAIPESQRIDVRYADMDADWRSVMARIYAFLDLDIAPALPAMTRYLERAERERTAHPHRYSLTAFGLDEGEVGDRFESYTQAFDLAADPGLAAPSGGQAVAGDPAFETEEAEKWAQPALARTMAGVRRSRW
jgi:hypothetical protein